jgi:hypothetical protein
MLTIFSVPKPFRGRVGDIQRNAIESWRALGPAVQVVLVGDEEGVGEAARDAGVDHVGGLARNDRGTPRLDSAFERTGTVVRWPLWCFVNADIVLLDDFSRAVERVASAFNDFLIIGETRDLDVAAGARLGDAAVRRQLRKRAADRGRLRGYAALDYFVFPNGLFDPLPPFLIGRACFDNWLVWRARERRRPVVDATRSVVAVHQSHDYSHVPGGFDEAYYGEEARYNEQLAGGREHIYSLHDATHRLYPKGPPLPYWGSMFRAREKARVVKVTMDVRMAARRARKSEMQVERAVRLLGVFLEPSNGTTDLLDELAEDDNVELNVLYAAEAPAAGAASARPLRHTYWFPRSYRIARLERALGREYPITPTIWHSFYFLRPDCMLIYGLSTFSAQSAIAWCLTRRVPYLLIDEHGQGIQADGDRAWRRLLIGAIVRRGAGIVVRGQAMNRSMLAYGVRSGRVRDLRDATDVTAAGLIGLARSAREDSAKRRARRLRNRAASLHRRKGDTEA